MAPFLPGRTEHVDSPVAPLAVGKPLLELLIADREIKFSQPPVHGILQQETDQDISGRSIRPIRVKSRFVPQKPVSMLEAKMKGDRFFIEQYGVESQPSGRRQFIHQCAVELPLIILVELAGPDRHSAPCNVLSEEFIQVVQDKGRIVNFSKFEFPGLVEPVVTAPKALFVENALVFFRVAEPPEGRLLVQSAGEPHSVLTEKTQ